MRIRDQSSLGLFGLEVWFVVAMIFLWATVGIAVLAYHSWFNAEQVYLSFTCADLSFTIQNQDADTQLLWHYKDRCLGGEGQ
jgi:hypothetical protein